jgi:hypothetical protein
MGRIRTLLRRIGLGGERGAEPSRSKRLTFTYDASGVRLTRETIREKPAPRGDDLRRAPRPDRLWVEVRGSTGAVLYRQTVADAIPQHAEVFEPDGRIRSVPYTPDTGVFSVIVPFDDRTEEAVVVAGPQAEFAQEGLEPAALAKGEPRELARAPLKEG